MLASGDVYWLEKGCLSLRTRTNPVVAITPCELISIEQIGILVAILPGVMSLGEDHGGFE